jgi:hypothetical protein
MSTQAESLHLPIERDITREVSQVAESAACLAPAAWDPERFAAEQIRGLVRQVFLAGATTRQVVFSAVDDQTDVGGLCLQVGRTLSEQAEKPVCIVQATQPESWETNFRKDDKPLSKHGVSGGLRDSCRQLSSQLWVLPREAFWGEQGADSSADVLGRRLNQLRAEFDFSVVQAPAAGSSGIAAMLGRLSDGVILVVEARATRRMKAQKAQADLRAAAARLLGTVLSERTFPIPEVLYRRL